MGQDSCVTRPRVAVMLTRRTLSTAYSTQKKTLKLESRYICILLNQYEIKLDVLCSWLMVSYC